MLAKIWVFSDGCTTWKYQLQACSSTIVNYDVYNYINKNIRQNRTNDNDKILRKNDNIPEYSFVCEIVRIGHFSDVIDEQLLDNDALYQD